MRTTLGSVLVLAIWMFSIAEGAEVRELITKLKSKDPDTRRAGAKELSELGPEGKPAIPDLIRCLRDKDLFVRRFSAEALGNIGTDAKSGITALAAAMNDERKEVQLAAVDALGKIGPDSVPALLSALKDPNKDPAVRKRAATGLGKIGLQARGAVPTMAGILSGKMKGGKKKAKGAADDDIRIEVATALGTVARADDKSAIDALKLVSEGKQRNKALQKAARDSLRKITGKAPAKKKKQK